MDTHTQEDRFHKLMHYQQSSTQAHKEVPFSHLYADNRILLGILYTQSSLLWHKIQIHILSWNLWLYLDKQNLWDKQYMLLQHQ